MMKSEFLQFIDSAAPYFAPVVGGLVDYVNQISKGVRRWNFLGFIVHLASALFFGWVIGKAASGLGYESDLILAASGFGGFMGVRVADLISYKFLGDRRRS